MAKQQFNVNLPSDLIRRIKHHAIDVQLSLSDLTQQILEDQLASWEARMADMPVPGNPHQLTLQPMVHVEQMAASVSFYERLGGRVLQGSRDGDWVLMELGGGQISLLAHPPNPDQDEGVVELNFQSRAPLDELEIRLRAEGVAIAQPTTDEGFGRQLQIKTPDGLLLKINELEPELYR